MSARFFAIAAVAIPMLAAATTHAAEHRVTMAGMAYQPAEITAKVGDTIVFVNDNGADHAVFVPTKGHAINLGTQKPGTTTVLPLRRPGSFEVECVNHADMLLKVTVQQR